MYVHTPFLNCSDTDTPVLTVNNVNCVRSRHHLSLIFYCSLGMKFSTWKHSSLITLKVTDSFKISRHSLKFTIFTAISSQLTAWLFCNIYVFFSVEKYWFYKIAVSASTEKLLYTKAVIQSIL